MKASTSLVIDRPPQEVFDFVSDPENLGRWLTGVGDAHLTSHGALGAGSTFSSSYAYGAKEHHVTYIVTEFAPPILFGFTSTSGPFDMACRVELTQFRGGAAHTVATVTLAAEPDSRATSVMFALFGPFLRSQMRKQILRGLKGLRRALAA